MNEEIVFDRKRKIIYGVLAVAIALAAYYFFFYTKTCGNQQCFEDSMRGCKRASFITSGNMTFQYTIKGTDKNQCVIEVLFLKGEITNQDSLKLKDRTMNCYSEKGAVVVPEANLDSCHGELKEELQTIIISKLHKYIVQNLGKINGDLFQFDK